MPKFARVFALARRQSPWAVCALSASQQEENSLSLPLELLDPHVRGRRIISYEEATEIASTELQDWDYGLQWGGLRVPSTLATTHFCFVGATGSGKTVLMRLLMQSVLPLIGKADKTKPPSNPLQGITPSPAPVPTPTVAPPIIQSLPKEPTFPLNVFVGVLIIVILFTVGYIWRDSPSNGIYPTWIDIFKRLYTNPYYHTEEQYREYMLYYVIGAWVLMVPLLILLVFIMDPYWEEQKRISALNAQAEKDYQDRLKQAQQQAQTLGTIRAAVSKKDRAKAHNDKQRALIYDAKQDVLSIIWGMGNVTAPVAILNPFDADCSRWNMAKDIKSPATALQVASLLIPENKQASQPFFDNASRHILTNIFIALMKKAPEKWSFRDVVLATHNRRHLIALLDSVPETRHIVELYSLDNFSSQSQTPGNIMANIATHMAPFEFIAAVWSKAKHEISLKDWIENEYILVLGNDEEHRTALDALNRVMFKRISELILAQPETDIGRTWIFLDEAREAGQLEGLGRLMTKGRSKGAAIVLGFQDVEGMREAYGEKQAHEIIGMCANKVILRVEGPETAKWASETFGEFEAFEEKHGWNQGGGLSAGRSYQRGRNISQGFSTNRSRGSSQGSSGYSTNYGTSQGENYSIGESISYSVSATKSINWGATINRERMQRASLMPSQFQSLPPTREETGLGCFFASPYLGAFDAFYEGDSIFKLLSDRDPNKKNFEPRPMEDQYLDPWDDNDFRRLSLVIPPPPPPAPNPQQGQNQPPQNSGAQQNQAAQNSNAQQNQSANTTGNTNPQPATGGATQGGLNTGNRRTSRAKSSSMKTNG